MPRIGVVRGTSYGLFGPPDDFGDAARGLGARLVRACVYWHQVEPEPGRYDWTVVDRLLAQVADGGRLWVTVCSSSPWATRTPTTFVPSAPPLDPATYARFVEALVRRCADLVEYWQCEDEPGNTDLRWAGSTAEYAALLDAFATAVRAVPGAGHVVIGGIGYDVLSTERGSEQWQFFDAVLDAAADAFDLADVHLDDDPRRVPSHLAAVRELLARNVCDQPLVVGEFGSRLADLPPFLDGSPVPAASRDRIVCRELVTRSIAAFAEGVTVACCGNLAPEVPGETDPPDLLGLVPTRLPLLDFAHGRLVDAQPAAATFRVLAVALQGAIAVERITLGDRSDVRAFTVVFPDGSDRAIQVLWREAGPLEDDADAREAFEWQWVHDGLFAVNAFAEEVPLPAWTHGRLAVPLSATPVLLSSTPLVGRFIPSPEERPR